MGDGEDDGDGDGDVLWLLRDLIDDLVVPAWLAHIIFGLV
jgi:hypothetical protein